MTGAVLLVPIALLVVFVLAIRQYWHYRAGSSTRWGSIFTGLSACIAGYILFEFATAMTWLDHLKQVENGELIWRLLLHEICAGSKILFCVSLSAVLWFIGMILIINGFVPNSGVSFFAALGATIVAIITCGALGCTIGGLMGIYAPGNYRGLYRGGQTPGFDSVGMGMGLGLMQGIAFGTAIGIAAVVLLTRYRLRKSTMRV